MAYSFWHNGSTRDSWYETEVTAGEVFKGAVAGAVGGLAAAWIMNRYHQLSAKLGKKMGEMIYTEEKERGQPSQQQAEDQTATAQVASAVSRQVLDRELTPSERKIAGPMVHYGYGTLMGALYGGLAEVVPAVTAGSGLAYGTALWAGGDEIALPALGLSEPPTETPVLVHADALVAHFVYGMTTEAIRYGVRRALDDRPRRRGLHRYFRRENGWAKTLSTMLR